MNHTKTKPWGPLVAGLFAAALLAGPGFAQGETVYDLVAGTTTLTLPDSTEITMWGFGLDAAGISVPGPRLTVPSGNTLRINLTNNLPVPVSIVIPGQAMPLADGATAPQVSRGGDGRIQSFTHETAPSATASYVWTSLAPGTYLYHSGTHPAIQVQMGLYGAVTKDDDVAAGQLYGRLYDSEALILYSEVDPAVHSAVATAVSLGEQPSATVHYKPKYFLVNGNLSSPALPGSPAEGDTVLLRLLNAGLKAHAPTILGLHLDLIAEDGKPYPFARKQVSLRLAAGKTIDAIVTPAEGTYPIFDRRLYKSLGGTGTMLTKLQVTAPPAGP